MKGDKTIPCIVCKDELENCYPGKNQPNLALEFTTAGHYGSTEFDPMDGTRLAINVCDECLREHRAKGHILYLKGSKYSRWERATP